MSDLRYIIAALATRIEGLAALEARFLAAEDLQKLSGWQMRAKFSGAGLGSSLDGILHRPPDRE